MSRATGQNPGHGDAEPAPGLSWADLLASLIEAHGTLTAVAWRLVEHADSDDVASVERALRRLRGRGHRDGGVWGRRLLRAFGVPAPIEARLRWMGLYHSPFNDLPVGLCLDQLRLWDRPPIAASRARIWLQLGHASCALRTHRRDDAALYLARARDALAGPARDHDDARLEVALIDAFLISNDHHDDAIGPALDHAAALLAAATLAPADRACFAARLADQRAYQHNRAGEHGAALALYEALPDDDVHPFASYRRDAGRAYGAHVLGRSGLARGLAERACQHAGDGGYVRLRAMGLLLIATVAEADGDRAAAEAARARAGAIAERLDDEALRRRVARSGERAARVT